MVIKTVLINKESICFFFKDFGGDISADPILLSGFLSAMSNFIKDLSQDKDQIKAIIMGKSKILYHLLDENHDINMVIIADRETDETDLKTILKRLEESFLAMFKIQDVKQHYNTPNFFNQFEKTTNDIIKIINEANIDETIEQSKIFPIGKKPEIDLKNVSLPFLLKTFKKHLAKIIYSMYIGKRIIVTGADSTMVKLTIDSLELFSPNKTLKKIYWTNKLEETDADIVGVPPELAGLFIDSTVINLKDNSVSKIRQSKYFEDLLKKIQKLDLPQAKVVITEMINFLEEKTKELLNIINSEDISKTNLESFIQNMDRDILKTLTIHLQLNVPRSINRIEKIYNQITNIFFTKDIPIV